MFTKIKTNTTQNKPKITILGRKGGGGGQQIA